MLGLVLEGGGARGAYQIGACKALREMGVEFSAITGTSIGAINGAILAQGNLEKAYELWYNITPSQLFDVREEYLEALKKFELKEESISYFLNLAKDILNNRGLNTAQMREFLSANISEEKIRQSGILYGLVTISLTDRKPVEIFLENIPPGLLIDYIMASAGLPIFRLDKFDGKDYLDGGFYNNVPINMLYARGYKEIIAIRTHTLGRIIQVRESDLSLTTIEPDDSLGGILDFSQDGARKNLLLGYFDAYKVFQRLKGQLYYIKAELSEEEFKEFLLALGENAISKGADVLGISTNRSTRKRLTSLLLKINELSIWKNAGLFESAVLSLCEALAKHYEIDRYQIYSFQELLIILAEKYHSEALLNNKLEPEAPPLVITRLLTAKRRQELLEAVAKAILGDYFDRLLAIKNDR